MKELAMRGVELRLIRSCDAANADPDVAEIEKEFDLLPGWRCRGSGDGRLGGWAADNSTVGLKFIEFEGGLHERTDLESEGSAGGAVRGWGDGVVSGGCGG
jgi:hypothetical protein